MSWSGDFAPRRWSSTANSLSTPAGRKLRSSHSIRKPARFFGKRAFVVCDHMYCLDLANGLRSVWIGRDEAFGDYGPLIASDDRVLIVGAGGELILVDARADEFRIVSRLKLFSDSQSNQARLLGYPALVNTRLYLRGDKELVCVDLAPRN